MPLLTRCLTSQLSLPMPCWQDAWRANPSADAPAVKKRRFVWWLSQQRRVRNVPPRSTTAEERLHTRWCRFCLFLCFRRGRSTLSVPRTIRLPHLCEGSVGTRSSSLCLLLAFSRLQIN
jgi:hypothetical protein